MPWDAVVARTVAEGWSGLATMSGIPGLAGATPIQNVGAYGSEVADTHCADRARPDDRRRRDVGPGPLPVRLSHQRVQAHDRYVVLDVTFAAGALAARARRSATSNWPGGSASAGRACRSGASARWCSELRRSKGMLLDADDHDTWSVGSFFVNPFVEPDAVPDGCPHWEVDGQVKLSAAWLIENAGFGKGYG